MNILKKRLKFNSTAASPQTFDVWLLLVTSSLLAFGLVMVTSASLPLAERLQVPMFYFAWHQAVYIMIGLVALYLVTHIPLSFIQRHSHYFLMGCLCLLTLLLLPGMSRPVNGSLRWLSLGPISIQPSELAKLSLILYIAGYMVRRNRQLTTSLKGFLIPMSVLALVALLLLLEPDFGSVVVIACTILGMLFLGGAQVKHFMILVPFVLCVLGFFVATASYRIQRFIAFRDPWADQFDKGYQLVQSLIAFGRGSWFGAGLGNSVQKLLYLPEPHTDFIFAVVAEELGLIGVLIVIFLYMLLIIRAMDIGRKAQLKNLHYAGNCAYGIGLLISVQAVINISVCVGLLPTKGLTLPLFSAGGSSMVMTCVAIGLLFRIDFEQRQQSLETDLEAA